jgi:PKD repeat protein
MKKITISLSICLLLALTLFAGSAAAADGPHEYAPVREGFTTAGRQVLPYAPNRILVRFTASSLQQAQVNIDHRRGAEVSGARMNIASVDALSTDIGVVRISRPFREPKNTDEAARLGIDRWFMLELPAGADVLEAAARYAADPNVEHAKPDYLYMPTVVPSDPLYADHWGHNNTAQLPGYDWGGTWDHTGPPVGTPGFDANAQGAWDGSQGFGSSNVIIAIIDSGVDIDHPDLNLVAGYDFGDNDSNPDDNSAAAGHGTCCAGVAASLANNGRGACGAAPGCRVMPCKIADSGGSMYTSYIANAITWAADNGADVLSMSLGAYLSSDPSMDSAIAYAYSAGCVILAATSNDNYSYISYPANHAYVIGVGAASPCGDRKRSSSLSSECNPGVATDPNGYTCDGERWWGSNYGPSTQDAAGAVDILGPTILPTTDIGGSGGYTSGDYDPFFNGTSCATPYVAGVCALIKSKNPTWTPTQIRDQLVNSAIDIINVESGSGWDRYSGYGMVDAEAAVGGGGPVPPTAEFEGAPTSGLEPLEVSFTDLSTGSPTSWSWTFGDGGTSYDQNPTYTYTSAGIYTVSLTATNAEGSDTETKTDYITVTAPPPPVAQFSGTPTSGEAPLTVTFTDASTNNPTSWYWDFGDGGNSTDQNPVYEYTAVGTYTVTLTATNAYGSDDEVKTDYITVTEQGVAQKNYAVSETAVIGTVSGDFTDTRASDNVRESIAEIEYTGHPRKRYSYLEHRWTFNVPSSSTVTFFIEAYRPASPDGDNFVFAYSTDGAAYTDLVTVASATEQVYSAAMPASVSGTVYIRVLDTDRSWGNIDLDAIYVDEMYIETETVAGPPTADFAGSPTSGYVPLTVDFTDLSTGAPTSWSWTFGDGGTSTAQNPSYEYAAAGTYTVTLTATNAYGSDVETKTDYITVNEAGAFTVHTQAMTVTRKTAGPNNSGQVYVTVVDQDNVPVSGAAVYGFFNEPNTSTKSGTTGSDGVAFIEGDKTKSAVADFCFEVTDVVLSGYAYDAGANAVTLACESGDVYNEELFVTEEEGPQGFALFPNHPNPFNPTTTISFSLSETAHVRLDVFNVAGQRVATLVNETRKAGVHDVIFEASHLSSGIYFYRLTAGSVTEIKKMILLR